MSDVVMGDPKTVLEGGVKYRDKKKWKSRWAVVSKLSPVADCLHIQLYRDSKERCKNGPTKASLSLEEFLGMETGFTLDKESNTMALVCSELVVVLAFDNRELLIQWQVKIRANLVEEQQFLVQIAHVPPKSKLPCGPARLHLQDHNFCLVSSVPPRLLGTWPIKELRRFGVIEGKFCFEGGSLCGKGEGLHVLLTNQCEELSRSMDLASKGKLLGKRKTLTRKNSMLETSSRVPLHKRCHLDKSGDSNLPAMSSGSECSTCDACSEVLRTADACVDDIMYSSSSASVRASSCRIHYRWPSCLSRWGQSSTTTAGDVDSVDTVSVILSDFQGSHSGTMSHGTNGHGQSMSCLCDTQGTWPFNQCSKCGRQLYSRHSLQSCKSSKPSSSPERSATVNEERDAFSPQWTMDSVVGSRKDQNNSTHDRASLCSRASHSSSNSGASSSGSEYSVPKNFLETLYDKPKNVQQAMNGTSNGKSADPRRTIDQQPSSENCILCPCHEPMADWLNTQKKPSAGQPDCACWSKLAMASVRSEVDIRMVNGRKSASANPSPSSSPKKSRYGASSTLRPGTNSECEMHCTCGKGDPYANYAIPKSALMHPKDVPVASGKTNGSRDAKLFVPAAPAEDYDVPKKFQDLLSNCDMTQKSSAIKSISNGPSCSCMSACKIVQNIELFKMASKQQHSFGDGLRMCACRRVMLWAGSLVPCLGPQRPSLEGPSGGEWQCPKSWFNSHPGAVCSEPHRTAEVVMVNGKPKHVLREASVDSGFDAPHRTAPMRPRASTVSYPLTTDTNGVGSTNYANLEFAASEERLVKVSDEPSAVNYANIEFAETLSLYGSSSLVLSRMDGGENGDVCASKPPLPPRSARKQCESPERDKEKCKCKQTRSSPKKTNAVNGSAYEMMSYPKNPSYSQSDEDYLMMQPLCVKSEPSPSKQITDGASSSVVVVAAATNQIDEPSEPDISTQSTLPLRPFMPYSYPISESGAPEVFAADSSLSRKHQLINEDLHLRAMRSNSLSELKKKVLMRKRSSSVDGKNNGYLSKDSGVESVPASPVGSPRPSAQRKNSLFSKLTLRSKEKSMSTNEIALPPLPAQNGTSCTLTIAHKNGHHRSADCLKPSEDFTNSDEDLNSDSSDFVLHKDSVAAASPMKRSSSVPCRAAMPTVTVTSPAKGVNHRPVEELNDLNKEPSSSVVSRRQQEEEDVEQEPVQRKYSLDSHERKKRVLQGVRSNCDNMYRQEGLDESDTVMEMQGILRRNHIQSERGTVAENYRSNTSSCSSSDISDYMESLSFISRSSSSSSGSADYMRSEDLYGQGLRAIPKPPPPLKNTPPGVHQSSRFDERALKHRSFTNDGSSSTDSSSDHHPCYKVKEEPSSNPRPCASRSNRDSRSSTSSTSSLSTSPSVTDYSSSSSSSPQQCPNALCGNRQVFDRRKQELLAAQQQPSAFVFSNNSADKEVKKS